MNKQKLENLIAKTLIYKQTLSTEQYKYILQYSTDCLIKQQVREEYQKKTVEELQEAKMPLKGKYICKLQRDKVRKQIARKEALAYKLLISKVQLTAQTKLFKPDHLAASGTSSNDERTFDCKAINLSLSHTVRVFSEKSRRES